MSSVRLSLGAMNFGKRTDAAESARIVARALDAGITDFDTANVYNDGESERLLGRLLGKERQRVKIATKVGMGRVDGRAEGLAHGAILHAAEASLERLGTDWIDVYYLHVPDHATPITSTLDGIADLLQVGKIRAWGVSNYAAWQVLEMLHLCDRRGMARPVIAQQLYNILIRELEVEYLPFAKRYALATTVYNPLAGGLLTGKLRGGSTPAAGSRFAVNKMYPARYLTQRMHERVEVLAPIAEREGLSLIELSYAWLASRAVDSVLVGPAEVAHLEAAIAALAKSISPEGLLAIDAAFERDRGTNIHYVR